MSDYSYLHVERYGHGKLESNDLADEGKVVFEDGDGHYDVYECDTDEEADEMAKWYVSLYESYPAQVEIDKQSARYFSIEIDE